MLHGVTKGELNLSQNINKYLDMCTKCGKCDDFCPSGIKVCKILNTAKYEYVKTKFSRYIIAFLESRLVFNNIIKFFGFISKPFRPKYKAISNPDTTVVYFKGCVNNICPRTDIYINKIFANSSIKIIEPDFECCGLPFLSEGNLERFIEAANYNMNLLSREKYDYLVTDCASCEHTLLEYSNYIESSNFIERGRSINWGDLIAVKGIKFKFNKPVRVTFHKPCHLKNDAFFNQILKNCENVEYVEMEDYDECCGLSGSFALKNFDLFNKLSTQKAKNVIKTEANYVLTTCPACVASLKYGLSCSNNSKIKVMSLLQFLASADEIYC